MECCAKVPRSAAVCVLAHFAKGKPLARKAGREGLQSLVGEGGMKFGKQLEISANGEWRDHYVQYKRLKRLIKRVAFEVEKQERKTEKLQQQLTGSPGGDVQLRVVDETHPLLKHVVDEVQDAKDQFWEVTNANLKIVNDFYTGRIVSLRKSIITFEDTVADEENSRGHVHSRGRTLSQGNEILSASRLLSTVHPYSRQANSESRQLPISIKHTELLTLGYVIRFESDHGFAALQDMYDTLVDLRTFVQINHSGFRKIVKKVQFLSPDKITNPG